ncbi:MAG TPA: hypothetical protein VFO44_01595 [Steroidobacteraceae bacterium]|nr:hypothetical protein [Steroidobacteraceae bacterium]
MSIHSPTTWVIVALVVIALIVLAWRLTLEARQRQSRRLQQRFGPEYARLLAERGDRTKTEAELRAREKRVEKLTIVALSPEDKAKFSDAWSALQARFVDNPESVVLEADRLVRDLMVKRGYPMGDFERRAADISVDYPRVVEAYRSARAIAVRAQGGEASTEELRKAVVYYRTLFAELLEVPHVSGTETENREVTHS